MHCVSGQVCGVKQDNPPLFDQKGRPCTAEAQAVRSWSGGRRMPGPARACEARPHTDSGVCVSSAAECFPAQVIHLTRAR